MKLLPDLSWCPRALLLYPAAAAAEDKALRGRNPSAACSGYTAGRVAAKQPDWSVPAAILRKRKIHSKYRSNHSDQDSSGAANHFLPNKPTNKKPKIPRFHCPQFRVKYNMGLAWKPAAQVHKAEEVASLEPLLHYCSFIQFMRTGAREIFTVMGAVRRQG